jgi:hypothetical protein
LYKESYKFEEFYSMGIPQAIPSIYCKEDIRRSGRLSLLFPISALIVFSGIWSGIYVRIYSVHKEPRSVPKHSISCSNYFHFIRAASHFLKGHIFSLSKANILFLVYIHNRDVHMHASYYRLT